MTRCCGSCGSHMEVDAMRCLVCAQLVPCALWLHGPATSIVLRVETPIGRALLERLGLRATPRLAWCEFRLRRDDEGFWCIERDASSSGAVTLNGQGIDAAPRRFRERDLIGLQGGDQAVRIRFDQGAAS